jgi:heme oxygenase
MTKPHDAAADATTSRWRRLKDGTAGAHQLLDDRIMAADPFASRERYGAFVRVQHAFHRHIDALYSRPELEALFPDLKECRRLPLIVQDLADLGISPTDRALPAANEPSDTSTAMGWLYVAEGSNLGAAFLLKAAQKLGLGEEFGARHLAASPKGRAPSWRLFTAALDAPQLSDEEERRVVAGAVEAFACVRALVEEQMPLEKELAPANC